MFEAELQQGPADTDRMIGERLKWAREHSGLSQSQAAQLLGYDHVTLSTIESGKRAVKAIELHKFCEVYDIGYDWLLGDYCEEDLPGELIEMVEKLPTIDRRKLLKTLASFGSMY